MESFFVGIGSAALVILAVIGLIVYMVSLANEPKPEYKGERNLADYFKFSDTKKKLPVQDSIVTFIVSGKKCRGRYNNFGQYLLGSKVIDSKLVDKWKYRII